MRLPSTHFDKMTYSSSSNGMGIGAYHGHHMRIVEVISNPLDMRRFHLVN